MKTEGSMNFRSLGRLWPWLKINKKFVLVSLAFIPLSAIIDSVSPLIVKHTIDDGIVAGDMTKVWEWAAIYLGAVVLSYLFRAAQAMATATAVHRMIFDLRTSLVQHVLHLPSSFHDKQLSGALATRATGDFDNLSESLNQGVLSSLTDIVALIGCVVGMFVLSPKLALVSFLVLPLVTFIVLWFSRKLNETMMLSRKKIAALNGFTQEALASVSVVKLLSASKQVSRRYRRLNEEYRDAQMQSVFYDALMFATLDGVASITLGIILFAIVKTFNVGQDLTAGVVIGFVQYMQLLFEPLKQLGTKMAMLQGAFTSIERIFGLLDRTEHVPGKRIVHWSDAPRVVFDHVSFSYGIDAGEVLKDVCFDIPKATSLAIVGSTGSGKSTIVKLLCKMYAGYSGSINLDGIDIVDLDPVHLRQHMAIVPQDIILFEGSVAFNISLGSTDVTEEQMRAAAAVTGADRFIRELPGQYQFQIKEGGSNLSHGQRQLLVFTRALVRQPQILVLDEATSAIDTQSEALIQDAIARILKGRTVIIIAHRLNTIERCDKVLVLERGRVQEFGTAAQLLAKRGRFFELKQRSGQVIT